MSLLFLFLDGVGIGKEDPEVNPLVGASMPTLRDLLGGYVPTHKHPEMETGSARALSTDATLGVLGIPQSATGQAAILTGRNVPALIGEHYGPRPDHRIRPLLESDTLFHALVRQGKRVAFANAYPERYFRHVNSGRRLPGAWAYAARAAGIPLRTAEDLAAGQAISVDFTNEGWREMLGYADMPLRTPEESGHIVARLLQTHDLVVVEQWATDMVGHRQDREGALTLLAHLDRFLRGLLDHLDLSRHTVLITSDHGNLEDLSTRRHTRNPVPTIVIGRGVRYELRALRRLDGIRRWVENRVLDVGTGEKGTDDSITPFSPTL